MRGVKKLSLQDALSIIKETKPYKDKALALELEKQLEESKRKANVKKKNFVKE